MNVTIKNSVGIGLPVFRPEGAWIKTKLRDYLRAMLLVNKYQEVESPAIGSIALFEKSGHYPYYKDSMFPIIQEVGTEADVYGDVDVLKYALKPMNCPFHIAVYQDEAKSYNDLPVRYFEFGKVYRMEDSGSVNGLLRSRAFEQDDGHVFCAEYQIQAEIVSMLKTFQWVFEDFGIKPMAKISIRGEESAKYIGEKELWMVSQHALASALDEAEIPFEVQKDAAAFYGPKIDFVVTDKLGRAWQLGTIQLDFNLPARFDLTYRSAENILCRPVLIHRAILGSLERFIGFLISEDKIPDFIHPKLFAIIPVDMANASQLYRANQISDFLFKNRQSNKKFLQDEPLRARINRAYQEGYRKVFVFGNQELAMEGYCGKIDNLCVNLMNNLWDFGNVSSEKSASVLCQRE